MNTRMNDILAANNQILCFHDRSEKNCSSNGERLFKILLMLFDQTSGSKTSEEVPLMPLVDMIVGRR